ncbi:hypothetical protein SUGI_0025400 [Cryptomeria japonica]|nr:hypothetical protein SUGI_0025400 [Cryptomeria japonica]
MGNCISTSCKRGSSRSRGRDSVPHIKDTATPKGISSNCPTPSHGPNPSKDKFGKTQCISPQKPSVEVVDCTEEKRVVVHETLRDAHSSPARVPIKSLKENKNVNLSSQTFKPARAFSGKPIDRQIHVGRRSQESTPTRPRPCRTAASPARGFEHTSSRKPDFVEPRPQKVPVKRQNFGELRSGSPSFRATKGCTGSGMKSGDSLKRANSSRRTNQIRGKDIACFEPQKLEEEVAEKPKNALLQIEKASTESFSIKSYQSVEVEVEKWAKS